MIPIRAVIFDFDGVITDSERLHWKLYQQVLEPHGAGFSWDEYTNRWMALHDEGCMQAVFADRGIEPETGLIARLVTEKARLFEARISKGQLELFPGIPEFVRNLAAQHPLAICSGALRGEIEAVLGFHKLSRFFKAIVAAEDCEKHKPDPEPYERALEAVNHALEAGSIAAPAECLVFEDTPEGIRAAKGAGMICVGVTHSYGAEKLVQADAIIDGFSALDFGTVLERLER